MEGLLPREFLEREQRRKFIETVEYQQIQQILADAVERFGLLEGATPTRITDFMVHLPPVSKEEPSSGHPHYVWRRPF